MNSGTVLAGNDGCTTTTRAVRMMPATGVMSRMKLKFSPVVERGVALAAATKRSVYPSAGTHTTDSVPIFPASPAQFSLMNGWHSQQKDKCLRAIRSTSAPACVECGGNRARLRRIHIEQRTTPALLDTDLMRYQLA